jgi:hypothetical protein
MAGELPLQAQWFYWFIDLQADWPGRREVYTGGEMELIQLICSGYMFRKKWIVFACTQGIWFSPVNYACTEGFEYGSLVPRFHRGVYTIFNLAYKSSKIGTHCRKARAASCWCGSGSGRNLWYGSGSVPTIQQAEFFLIERKFILQYCKFMKLWKIWMRKIQNWNSNKMTRFLEMHHWLKP